MTRSSEASDSARFHPGLPVAHSPRLRRLAIELGPWILLNEPGPWSPGSGVSRDMALGSDAARGGGGIVRLWEGEQALVVTRREARLPAFDEAREHLLGAGWPVVVRDSGGTTVPHFPGALKISLFLPRGPMGGVGVEEVYRLLCEPVREALRSLGIDSGYGEVPGSFCDGRFNLVHAGRKVAGTAQRWKGVGPGHSRPPGYVLAHMILFVEGDLERAIAAVNRFLERAGSTDRFRADAQTTVARALRGAGIEPLNGPGPGGLMALVRSRTAQAFQRALGMDWEGETAEGVPLQGRGSAQHGRAKGA